MRLDEAAASSRESKTASIGAGPSGSRWAARRMAAASRRSVLSMGIPGWSGSSASRRWWSKQTIRAQATSRAPAKVRPWRASSHDSTMPPAEAQA